MFGAAGRGCGALVWSCLVWSCLLLPCLAVSCLVFSCCALPPPTLPVTHARSNETEKRPSLVVGARVGLAPHNRACFLTHATSAAQRMRRMRHALPRPSSVWRGMGCFGARIGLALQERSYFLTHANECSPENETRPSLVARSTESANTQQCILSPHAVAELALACVRAGRTPFHLC